MFNDSHESEKDCITKCDEEFIDCAEHNRSNCLETFKECSSVCESSQ
jgi:hypothetical protein